MGPGSAGKGSAPLSTDAESREPRTESREPRAESREPRAESREPRAESRITFPATHLAPMPPSSLRTLLDGAIDYAGLFPPAQLDMAAAVGRFAEHRAGPDCWLLGRFVVPVARLDELEGAAAPLLAAEDEAMEKGKKGRARSGPAAGPWRLAALLGADVERDAVRVLQFNSRHATGQRVDVVIDSAEVPARSREEIERAAAPFRDLGAHLYVELPAGGADPRPLVDAAFECGARVKVRTGGVVADAFPSAAELARVIAACAAVGVPFKATAGLHHPLRGDYRLTYAADAPSAPMFGFLNVFLAAALAREGLPAPELEPLLEERDPAAIAFDDDGATWRAHRLATASLARARREALTAVGSCSFAEPVDELRAMGLL